MVIQNIIVQNKVRTVKKTKKVGKVIQAILLIVVILALTFSCNNGGTDKNKTGKDTLNDSSKSSKKHKDIPKGERKFNDLARFIAGMSPEKGSAYEDQSNTEVWKKYAVSFDTSWTTLLSSKIDRMAAWGSKEVGTQKEVGGKVFYPFSGPDFVHMYTFFPTAKEYTMIGLENVGTVQELSKMRNDSLTRYLRAVENSLNSILNFSFFRTNSMSVDFKSQDLNGTIPVMLLFMARTGNKILDIKPVYVDSLGKVVDGAFAVWPKKGINYGVKIDFYHEGLDDYQTVYYYSIDLGDEGLTANKGYTAYLNNMGEVKTYVKSASYLMHYPSFSQIRSAVLKSSSLVLQDDSGVPLQYFDKEKWTVSLYGSYVRPIDLFHERFQKDLRAAYLNDSSKIKPLDFGIGYNYILGTSNLLIAKKKTK